MSEEVKIALISSAGVILGAVGNHFFKPLAGLFKSWADRKNDDVRELRKTISDQRLHIDSLENRLTNITLRMEILLPLLKRQMKDDPEALEMLKNFEITNSQITPSKL